MKIDKFENTIRRKLESITPEFHESDWSKMQQYMHANTPPTFWQQYGSWLGYAAAAAVTSVMVFLYVNQLSQNNNLLADVKNLKSQIDNIKNTPTVVQKTDTVYIVQHQIDTPAPLYRHSGQEEQIAQRFDPSSAEQGNQPVSQEEIPAVSSGERFSQQMENNRLSVIADKQTDLVAKTEHLETENTDINITSSSSSSEFPKAGINSKASSAYARGAATGRNNNSGLSGANDAHPMQGSGSSGNGNSGISNGHMVSGTPGSSSNNAMATTKTLGEEFSKISVQAPVLENDQLAISRRMQYKLVHRIAPRQVKNVLLAANPVNIKEAEKNVATVKKVESTKKAENAIPRFNIKTPYRFGIAQQWEGKNQVRTALTEVLLGKHLSVSAGVSWLKIKSENFYSDFAYNQKTKGDFKKEFYLPMFLKVYNMEVKSSVVQIPLNVAYRNNITNSFAYYVSAGTNMTLQAKQNIVYDCYDNFPDPRVNGFEKNITRKEIIKKADLNLFNSFTFSAGLEKSWHPVVIQAEGYIYSYASPLSPRSAKTGPGFKLKLLYQIGKKM